MGKFILYTVAGTLATFVVIVHLSLMPHIMQSPSFAEGVTLSALAGETPSFLFTLVLAWIAWWSVSGLLSLIFYSIGKYSGLALFALSLAAVTGITVLIT